MKTALTFAFAAGLLAGTPVSADSIGSAVTLELVTDHGALPLYPTAGAPGSQKAYAEAVKGMAYRIVVHNNLSCRVGLVIAVDGRNIVSGAKSWLGNDERMYVLDPGETQEYKGWRTAQDQENRFYFTTVEDSYAAAFKDTSAMGVVAMAAYPEYFHMPKTFVPGIIEPPNRPNDMYPLPKEKNKEPKRAAASPGSEAGTGYGEGVYSPSINVAFHPESQPREKTFIKYEWRETLKRLGVIRSQPVPGNRLWDSGFAPPPPRM
jgi:hypothetical protein